MGVEFFSISLIMLLAVVSPGPDFVLVTQNTLLHSKRKGFLTGLGIAVSNLFHTSYCLLGLTIIMTQSVIVFSVIKYLGAAYLIYMGIKALRAKKASSVVAEGSQAHMSSLSDKQAFVQGFLCNALNPKAALLFLSLFTVFITPETPLWIQLALGLEITLINFVWYSFVSSFLDFQPIRRFLSKTQHIMTKCMGAFLILFGIKLASLDAK